MNIKTKIMQSIAVGITTLTFACTPVFADESTKDKEGDIVAACESYQGLAFTIMNIRQSGVSLLDMLEAVSEDANIREYARAIVRLAFTKPKYSTQEMQSEASSVFANEVYMMCMQNASSSKMKKDNRNTF